jgi:hypothetical protein
VWVRTLKKKEDEKSGKTGRREEEENKTRKTKKSRRKMKKGRKTILFVCPLRSHIFRRSKTSLKFAVS